MLFDLASLAMVTIIHCVMYIIPKPDVIDKIMLITQATIHLN